MAYNFDENQKKAIFDQMYGKGAFDAGMQQARNVGRSKVQAAFAKDDAMKRLREAEAARKKAAREAEKASKKKTYDDALTYWNDPTNKDALRSKGVYRTEQEIRNDPRMRQQLKDAGFTMQDFIDGMYSAGTEGDSRSKREYDQKRKKQNFDVTPDYNKKTGLPKKKQPLVPILTPKEIKAKKQQEDLKKSQKKASKERDGFLGFLDSTLGRVGEKATRDLFGDKFANDMNENYAKTAKDKLNKKPTDKHSIQALQNLNTVTRAPKNKLEKASDFIGMGAGELAPYTLGGAYGVAGKVTSKLNNPLAKSLLTGLGAGTIAGTEKALTRGIASNERLTPQEYAKRIGMEAAFAGGGDAALTGAGMALKAASNKAMKGLLPSSEHLANEFGNALKDVPMSTPPTLGGQKLNMNSMFEHLTGRTPSPEFMPKTGSTSSIDPDVQKLFNFKTQNIKPVTLKTVNPGQSVSGMSKEELHSIRKNLLNQQKTAAKGNKKAIQEDITKVDGLLMKLDLQNFGKTPQEIAENAIKHSATPPALNVTDELQTIKDITPLQVGTKNIYEIADRLPVSMGDNVRKSLDAAKVKYVNHLKSETDDLYNYVVKELGIKKGTKESALVQDFGEQTLGKRFLEAKGIDVNTVSPQELANINLEQLKLKTDKWENVVKANEFFRDKYDLLINRVNAVREKIYPHNPEKIVPKRSNYYHHFNELEGLEGIKNLFDSPANISPQLEGVSPHTKPSAKFQGFMQRRGNGAYKSDAVGGFLKYVKAASHSINVDPVIPVLRSTAKHLADATEHSKNANKIIEALVDHANDLAGKTNSYDRVAQKIVGRRGMKVITAINSRVKSNMILGNVGSLVAQTGNIPLGLAKAKQYALPGLKDTMVQSFKELLHTGDRSAPIYKSRFLAERFHDADFRRFDHKLIEQPKKLAVWAMETVDKAASRSIWNSMHAKAVKEGIENPVKYADYETRKIIAGRGIGEVPLIQKSKVTQVLAPFTLEVGNQWKVFADMVGKKDATGIITYLVAAYGLNKAYESVRGSNVVYDPIDAIYDGYMHGEGGVLKKSLNAAGSLAGETIGNIPGGSVGLQMLGMTGMNTQKLFGERNPSRFGAGVPMGKAVKNPAFAVMPWGANQLYKGADGLKALADGGVYKEDKILGFFDNPNPFNHPKDELMYPIKKDLLKDLKLLGFGPSATPEAGEFFDNKRKPLNENQTKAYELLKKQGLGNDFYDVLRVQDTKASVKTKFTKIMKSDMTAAEKAMALEELLAEVRGTSTFASK